MFKVFRLSFWQNALMSLLQPIEWVWDGIKFYAFTTFIIGIAVAFSVIPAVAWTFSGTWWIIALTVIFQAFWGSCGTRFCPIHSFTIPFVPSLSPVKAGAFMNGFNWLICFSFPFAAAYSCGLVGMLVLTAIQVRFVLIVSVAIWKEPS